jgi:hypothetical protein
MIKKNLSAALVLVSATLFIVAMVMVIVTREPQGLLFDWFIVTALIAILLDI